MTQTNYINNYVFLQNNDKGLMTVTFKAAPDLLELLVRYALKYRLNRSEAIRKAIVEMIKADSTEFKKARVESGGRL